MDKNVAFPNQNWVLIQCVKLFFCWWLSHYQGRDYARFWLKLAQVISKPTPNLMGYQQEYNVICDNRFKAGSNFFWWQIPPKKTLCGWVPSEIFFWWKIGSLKLSEQKWELEHRCDKCWRLIFSCLFLITMIKYEAWKNLHLFQWAKWFPGFSTMVFQKQRIQSS